MKIEVKNVNKKFGYVTALKDVSVTFETGKIYGLVGRNGSGKSVFLKIVCGFYKPSSGEVLYDGENIMANNKFPPDTRALIEKPCFMPQLTGYENLKLLADIQHRIGKEEIIKSLEEVNLVDAKDKLYFTYSLGMKQKLGIAQVLMEDPEVMIFDEPFNGIERETANKLRKKLDSIKKNKIIIIASHIKEDIDDLADVVYEFDDGNLSKYKK